MCIDLCLAAQADTFHAARQKLEAQILEYVEDALTIDKAFADDLLRRKAPLRQRLEYLAIVTMARLHLLRRKLGHAFRTTLPVHVGKDCHA
ncbi:DUF1902 domain-containing protein [Pseudothauera rhizosphaerae]|uniref:DUF1902 domain-containing protein n=1 Tax=Pseudothauera rhizosphaerae TaxID=2565932 RepID=A0A4S4AAG9_9RHOO|nr:DUF1902 domain-containing protein [Pseudothauera rhizosphaerae]THF55897.1 DUF1902 domain-containing protein [Pseudothauera rhizosphaerae]